MLDIKRGEKGGMPTLGAKNRNNLDSKV